MDTGYSLSDLATITGKDGLGEGMWIILLIILLFGGNGNLFGRGNSDFSQFATSASQNEILLGQKFDALGQKVNQIGDGICSSTYALNNAIIGEGRTLQNCCCELKYDMANQFANVNANTTAQTQKILDAIAQDKIASLQAQVSELKTQNMFCGIPRISNYAYGVYPYVTNGCGCGNI